MPEAGPRLGVLVTRPQPEGEALAQRLRDLGYRTLLDPLLRIALLPEAAIPDAPWGGVLVTSAHGVAGLAARADAERYRGLPVLAVGARTAERARQAGFAAVTAAGGDVARLAEHVRRHVAPGPPLLYPTTAVRAGALDAELGAAGHAVVVVAVYAVQAMSHFAKATEAALTAGEVDAVLLTSRRTAESFARAFGHPARWAPPAAVCLSPAVAGGLGGYHGPVLVARMPTIEGLIEALRGVREAGTGWYSRWAKEGRPPA